jgi:thiol-disulfide isomerase/thioredoxin
MFKLILPIAFLAIMCAACGNNGFTIKGKIVEMPEQKFYLEQLGAAAIASVDSGLTKEDGSFSIKGIAAEHALYRVRFAMGKYIMFVVKNETAVVDANWNNLEEYRISGSQGSQTLRVFVGALRSHLQDLNSFDMITKNIAQKGGNKDSMMQELSAQIKKVNTDYANYVKQFADTTSLVPNATFAANILNTKVEGYFLKNFYEKLQKRFPTSDLAAQFAGIYKAKFANETAPAENGFVKKDDGTYKVIPADAKPATDFSASTPDGQMVSLSSFKGKYVLIDFWASWCAPCRKENPNVLAAYRQYKDKNFTILGVSLDDDKAAWRNAIDNDGLTWTHVSELKKWSSVIARQYNITSIPSNVLVNPDGLIIATNLRGQELELKLAEVLE